MNNNGWQRAREHAAKSYEEKFGRPVPEGFRRVRIHDLKHTFGRRLRAAGVSFETRQVLLGHHNGSVTTHYSAAEIAEPGGGEPDQCHPKHASDDTSAGGCVKKSRNAGKEKGLRFCKPFVRSDT